MKAPEGIALRERKHPCHISTGNGYVWVTVSKAQSGRGVAQNSPLFYVSIDVFVCWPSTCQAELCGTKTIEIEEVREKEWRA